MKLMVKVALPPGGMEAPLPMTVDKVCDADVLAVGGTAPRLSVPTMFIV